jgi:hypothetical protein
MKASTLDLRRRTGEILRALDRNETITILYRGRKKGVIYPAAGARRTAARVSEHPAFGMWRDRRDMGDVTKVVRSLRKVRSHAL